MSKWYPCVYCTEDLRCTKYGGDGVVSFCVLGPCHDETPSNADRIRSMTDEELAEMHVGVGCPPGTGLNELCLDENGEELLCTPPRCRECWLDWLREEAHDEP